MTGRPINLQGGGEIPYGIPLKEITFWDQLQDLIRWAKERAWEAGQAYSPEHHKQNEIWEKRDVQVEQ